MPNAPTSEIWFHEESKTFYKIPGTIVFLKGDYPVKRFDGVAKTVQAAPIKSYEISAEEAEVLLKTHYETAKKVLSKAMSAMTQFSLLTNKAAHEDFSSMFENTSDDSILGKSQAWVKDFMATMQNENATEEEQKESFKSAFNQVPEILDFFNEASIKKAAENPEEWAAEMQEKMFGKATSQRKEKEKAQRQSEINDQIRANIEKAMNKNKS